LYSPFGFLWRNKSRDGWAFKIKEKKIHPGEKNTAKEGAECKTTGFGLLKNSTIPLLKMVYELNSLYQSNETVPKTNSRTRNTYITLPELCVMTEIIMRYLNRSNPTESNQIEKHTFFIDIETFKTLYGNI